MIQGLCLRFVLNFICLHVRVNYCSFSDMLGCRMLGLRILHFWWKESLCFSQVQFWYLINRNSRDGFSLSVPWTCFGNIEKQVLFPYFSVPVPCSQGPPPSYFLPFFWPWFQKQIPDKKKYSCFLGIPRARFSEGDEGWQYAVCARGSSDCWTTPSAGATAGAQPAVVHHTHGPRSFCRWIFCRWWNPKFCRSLDAQFVY